MGQSWLSMPWAKDNGHIVPEEVPDHVQNYVVEHGFGRMVGGPTLYDGSRHQQFMEVVHDVKSMVAAM